MMTEPFSFVEMTRKMIEADRESLATEKIQLAQDKLEFSERLKSLENRPQFVTSWWQEWSKPTVLITIATILGAQFLAYQNDKATMNQVLVEIKANISSLQAQVISDERTAQDRVMKYSPMLESNTHDIDTQKIRFENMVISVQDLSKTVGRIADSVSQMHEELAIERSRLKQGKAEDRPQEFGQSNR